MLDTGVHSTLEDLARAKGFSPSYVSGILRLTLLAPEIVEAILDGRQPAELQLDDLLKGFPVDWEGHFGLICREQHRLDWADRGSDTGRSSGCCSSFVIGRRRRVIVKGVLG